jgi:hypothetical protein
VDRMQSSKASGTYSNHCGCKRLRQRFSNYGSRTSGPRGVPLWSFKKDRRTNKIQMNLVSHYSWKYQSLEITHGNRLSLFLPVLTFYEIYYTTHSTLSIGKTEKSVQ